MRVLFLLLFVCCFIVNTYASDRYEIKSSHPRLIFTKEGELSLRFLLLENEGAQKIQSSLRKESNDLLDVKAADLGRTEVTAAASETFLNNVLTLTLAYRIFEDDRYAEKASELIMSICTQESWDYEDPAITGDFITATAIGYDWMYYFMNREVREVFRNSIVKKGLVPGLELIEKKAEPGNRLNNHPESTLAFSSAISLGALAVADFFPDLKNKVLYSVLVNNQLAFENLNFDDFHRTYEERWNKNLSSMAMMLSSFQASLGHDFNISALPSLKTFASDYFLFIKTNENSFETKQALNPSLLFFGKFNHNAEVPEFFVAKVSEELNRQGSSSTLNYICLPWLLE